VLLLLCCCYVVCLGFGEVACVNCVAVIVVVAALIITVFSTYTADRNDPSKKNRAPSQRQKSKRASTRDDEYDSFHWTVMTL
jgi:Na+/proline symporter